MEEERIRISADALIALIVTEAEQRELAALGPIEAAQPAVEPSPAFRQKMGVLLRRAKRRSARSRALTQGRRVLVSLAAVLSVVFCCLLPVKAVRKAVTDTLIQWHDQFMTVTFSSEAGVQEEDFPQIALGYLPAGLTLTQSSTPEESDFYALYEAGDQWLMVRVLPLDGAQSVALDNEYATYYALQFDGHDALWGVMGDGSNLLLWQAQGLSFLVTGSSDVAELIQVSQNIQITFAQP